MDIEQKLGPQNPFSLEGQIALAAAGIKVKRSRGARKAAQLADLYAKVTAAESDLARTFNRWQKYRAAATRLEKRLDKEFAENAATGRE